MASSLGPSVSMGYQNFSAGRGQSIENINPSDAPSTNPSHQPNYNRAKVNHADIDLVTGGFNEQTQAE